MLDNYAEESLPLFRLLRNEAFRFVIVFHNHYSFVARLKEDLAARFVGRKMEAIDCRVATYEGEDGILARYFKQESGILFLDHFEDILQLDHDSAGRETPEMAIANARRRGITAGLNLRRDRLAKYPIALVAFIGPFSEEKRAIPLMERMPDLWSFRSLILDLKAETKGATTSENPFKTTFRSLGNESDISSLGGNTEAEKRAELAKLEQQLSASLVSDKGLRLSLYEQMTTLLKELGEQERLQKIQQERNELVHTKEPSHEAKFWDKLGDIEMTRLPEVETTLKSVFAALSENEHQLLSVFAVLPNEWIPFGRLEELLSKVEALDMSLLSLVQKGWLDYQADTTSFKAKPIMRRVALEQSQARLFADCLVFLNALIEKLEYDEGGHLVGSNYADAAYYAHLAEVVVDYFGEPQNDIGILYERLGDFYQALGDLQKALGYYEVYLHLMEELLLASPSNLTFKNNLAISYEKLGTTHMELGDLEKALGYYEEDFRLAKELHEAHPSNVTFKNGLAISNEKLGETYIGLGAIEKALAYNKEFYRLLKELHEAYPSNVTFKNGFAISYSKLGDAYTALGDLTTALGYYEEYLRLAKELHEAYPSNVAFNNGLAISCWKLGDLVREMKDLEKAREYFFQCKQLLDELVQSFPLHAEFKKNLDEVTNDLKSLENYSNKA